MSKLSNAEYEAREKFRKGIYPLLIEMLNVESLNSSEMCERVKHTTVVGELLRVMPKLSQPQGISGSGKIDNRPKWYSILREDLGVDKPGYKVLVENGFVPVGKLRQRKWIKTRKSESSNLDDFLTVNEEVVEKKELSPSEKILSFADSLAKLAPHDKIFARTLEHAKTVYGE